MKRRNGKRMLLGAFFFLLFGSVLGSQWGGGPVETAAAQGPDGRAMTIRKTYTLSGQPVAQRTVEIDANGEIQSETLHTIYTNHLGSATTLMDEQGNVVSTQRFFPFGEHQSDPTSLTDRGFTGHLHNDDLGLIYMNARYYLPGVGRMLTPDTIVPDPAGPQAWNRYTYVYNNPLKYEDPSGHFPEAIANIDGDSIDTSTSALYLYAVAYQFGIYSSSVQDLAQNMDFAWKRHDSWIVSQNWPESRQPVIMKSSLVDKEAQESAPDFVGDESGGLIKVPKDLPPPDSENFEEDMEAAGWIKSKGENWVRIYPDGSIRDSVHPHPKDEDHEDHYDWHIRRRGKNFKARIFKDGSWQIAE